MGKQENIYKKLHKWPGLIISFLLLNFSLSGIFMNHREVFSGLDVNREILPRDYTLQNWNNASLKGNLIINNDSILVYGNIGIWLTNSTFHNYQSFNKGFPKGIDNRKIFAINKTSNGELYAATLFGLYAFNKTFKEWQKFKNLEGSDRFTSIESVGDTIYALTRSNLFKGKARGINTVFTKNELSAPAGYIKEVSLFQTIWQIHSGEIFGLPGKLFVDLLGLITAFLSLTGIIYFFFPGWIKRRFQRNRTSTHIVRANRWSLKWHNKLGRWTYLALIILFATGMFLRPPLLIPIAKINNASIKFTHLDNSNPWFDKLRDIIFDDERGIFLLSTSEGMFWMDLKNLNPAKFDNQPPVSVMGINVFQHDTDGAFLIGSFSGLFLWNPDKPDIINYTNGALFEGNYGGRPIGDFKITGLLHDISGNKYMIDYEKGVLPLWNDKLFPKMPANILSSSKMSLWNLCLEIHTGRFFHFLLNDFYILIVPLTGLLSIMVVFSGYFLWRKRYKNYNN